jgi:hypothetical protein
MSLTDKEVSAIAAAGVLALCASSELSEFDKDVLAAVAARFLESGPETIVIEME